MSSIVNPNMEAALSQESVLVESRTRREKVEDREYAIVTAARQMFNERGYAKTTIADIAAKSGVADGTVYIYFKNKQALAHGVLARFYNDLTLEVQAGVDELSTPQERLRFIARHHLTKVISNWRVLEMLPLINLPIDQYAGSDIYHMNKAYVSVFDRVAKDAVSQGFIIQDLSLWVLRDNFFGAIDYGARTIMMKGTQDEDIDIFVDSLMQLIFTATNNDNRWDQDKAVLSRLEQVVRRVERAAEKLETGG